MNNNTILRRILDPASCDTATPASEGGFIRYRSTDNKIIHVAGERVRDIVELKKPVLVCDMGEMFVGNTRRVVIDAGDGYLYIMSYLQSRAYPPLIIRAMMARGGHFLQRKPFNDPTFFSLQ